MTQKKVFLLTGFVLLLSLVLEALFVDTHADYWWHNMLGFDIIFGFLGAVITIIISKALGSLFIQRKEEYYGEKGYYGKKSYYSRGEESHD